LAGAGQPSSINWQKAPQAGEFIWQEAKIVLNLSLVEAGQHFNLSLRGTNFVTKQPQFMGCFRL
jgi:hypothetical protein